MRYKSEGVALTVLRLEADEALLPSGILSPAEAGRCSKGRREMGLANVGAGAARAVAVRCLGARDHTTVGGQRLDPGEAVAVGDVVEPSETEHLAEAWDGWPPIPGVGVMRCGGVADGQFHVAEPRVVGVQPGKVAVETLLHGGLGKPLRDTSAVRLIGHRLADCGPVIRARGMLEVGSQLRPLAQQLQAAPEESSRGPPRGGVHRGLGPQAATQADGNVLGVDRGVFGLTPRARLHVEGMDAATRDAVVRTEVGQPGPREQACDGDAEPCARGCHAVQKGLRGRLHLTVHEHLATLVEETDRQGPGRPIEATITLVRLGGEAPEVSSSFAC
jgi:hypothetical protein